MIISFLFIVVFSRCSSFKEASLLLEELRLFDNHVYGVAHGLLMGHRENVWVQALSLFDDVMQMDSSTASAFYNALTDMLWHFGQVNFGLLIQHTSLISRKSHPLTYFIASLKLCLLVVQLVLFCLLNSYMTCILINSKHQISLSYMLVQGGNCQPRQLLSLC